MKMRKIFHLSLPTGQGTDHKRYTQRGNPTERKQNRGKGKGKGKGKNTVRFYEIHSSDSDASSIHEDERSEVPDFIDVDYLDSVGATKLIMIESSIKVQKCYTCKEPFNRERMVPPYNFIFSRKTKRLRPDGKGGQIRGRTPTPAFFCARDMACLKVEFPRVKKGRYLHGQPNISLLDTITEEVPKTERLLGSNCPQ